MLSLAPPKINPISDALINSPKVEISHNYPTPPNSPPQSKLEHVDNGKQSRNKPFSSGVTTDSPFLIESRQNALNKIESKLREDKYGLTSKTRLKVDHKRCGALTKQGKPCQWKVPPKNYKQIDYLVESMASVSKSSVQLGVKLDELIHLVHCYHHDHGQYKESRILQWRQEVPGGSNATESTAMAVERRIRELLGLSSTVCIADEGQGQTCPQQIGGQKVQNCAKSINELVKPDVYLNNSYLEGFLKVLEADMYCRDHTKDRVLTKPELWKSNICAFLSTSNENELTVTKLQFTAPDFTNQPATYWPTAYDISAFQITGWGIDPEHSSDISSCYKRVQKMMQKPLDKQVEPGLVYLYEVEGNKGYVKIGYTTRSIEIRDEEWSFQCNRLPKHLYPIPSNSARKVLHPDRVESLCHAELDYCRARHFCQNCFKQHNEWFKITPEGPLQLLRSGPYG